MYCFVFFFFIVMNACNSDTHANYENRIRSINRCNVHRNVIVNVHVTYVCLSKMCCDVFIDCLNGFQYAKGNRKKKIRLLRTRISK